MIRFIQDYTTKSMPPEVFEEGQEVERSPQSEMYLVRLGVAGFLVDGKLLDADYQPIVVTTVVEVVSTDRRFAATGRGGEMLGLAAPDRASTGPGNAAVLALTGVDPDLHAVEVEQLRGDLAASMQQLDDHQQTSAADIAALTASVTAAQGEREAALADLSTAKADLATVTCEREDARAELTSAKARIVDLEAQLAAAAAAAPASAGGSDDAPKSTKAK